MRQTRAQAVCKSKLKQNIAIFYHKFENPKQAIAVSYAITKRKFPNCDRYLQRRRPPPQRRPRQRQQLARRRRQPVNRRRRVRQQQQQPLRRSQRIRNRRR